MIHNYYFILFLLLQVIQTNSELILNISAAVGETVELACNATPKHRLDPELTLAWYRCLNIHECELLIGTITPTSKCLSTDFTRFHFRVRSSEHRDISVIISDLQRDDAGFYKCVIRSQQQILTTQKVHLQIRQVVGPDDSQVMTTAVETTSTKGYASPSRPSSSVVETSLTSIAIAVWLGVAALLLFLCLYGRHLYLNSRLQASPRQPDVFHRTKVSEETTAGPLSTEHPLQRIRGDGPHKEDEYESLSRRTNDQKSFYNISINSILENNTFTGDWTSALKKKEEDESRCFPPKPEKCL